LLPQAKPAPGHPAVAPATRFVSHAWSYTFADLVEALEAHFAAQREDEEQHWLWLGACGTCGHLSAPQR
jgi:hypothetical protein